MEDSLGFLTSVDGSETDASRGQTASDCPSDAANGTCQRISDRRNFMWLEDYKHEACQVTHYSNTSIIPKPIRVAVNACVNKSGLSKVLPKKITAEREKYTAKLHTAVESSTKRREVLNSNGLMDPALVEGQGVDAFPFYGISSWAPHPTYDGHARLLQQLNAPDAQVHLPEDTNSLTSPPSPLVYLQSMPYSLLPIFVGFVVAGVALPVFIFLLCIRNRTCSRRLFSFWCCLRIFFKSSRQQLGGAGRWESNGISSTTPESQRQGSVQKLVPRRACLGTRYILLLAMILISSAVLGLGIYALVELHSLLSQLGCATGQAASTIINGQTFNNPPGASRLPTTNSPSFTAFSAPSPFGEVEFPILQTGSLSRSLATRSGLDFVAAPFAFPKATDQFALRLLQAEPAHLDNEESFPKRTGFLGFAPVLEYLEELLLAVDPQRPDSLIRELRQTSGMGSHITQTVSEIKRNIRKLQDVLKDPSNSGQRVAVKHEGGRVQNERSYHLAPVAAAGPSLLSTWDTLIYLLPQGLSAMAVASDQLAKDIEDSVDQTQNLPSVEQLQAARALLTESVDIARKYLKPTPRRSRPIFWGTILSFILMGSIVLLAALYLCCMCCCNREGLTERSASSAGLTVMLMLIAAPALLLSGAMLIATTAITDGCLYTKNYVKDANDIDALMHYFSGDSAAVPSSDLRIQGIPKTAAARVLEACLLPDKERDLKRVFGIEDLIATGTKMQEMGRVVVRGETTSAALLSLQLQDAAKELQLLEETYWLFLLDPMAIKEEELAERLFTYREVLCSGIQDKQRIMKASYLIGNSEAGSSSASGSPTDGEHVFSRAAEGPALLEPEDWRPADELAAMLQQLTANPGSAERLSASLQQALQAMQDSSDNTKPPVHLVGDVLGELMKLASGKSEAERLQLLQSLVRLAAKANAELQGDVGVNSGSAGSTKDMMKGRRERRQQRALLLELLRQTCLNKDSAEGPPEAAEGKGHFVVFGIEDIEERVAPFYLASLHTSSRREDSLRIDAAFDVSSPSVLQMAAQKETPEEQRRFLNAVWWAKQKELLRAEKSSSFQCPSAGDGFTPCSFSEFQEAMHALIHKLHQQLEELWANLRQYFSVRQRIFRLVDEDFADAASNLDCSIVHNELQPLGRMICDRVRPSGANVASLLLLLAFAALLLLPFYFCLWKAGIENRWRRKDRRRPWPSTNSAPNANHEWDPRSPAVLSASMSHLNGNNNAAAVAVAAAAAATAAAASGLAHNPMQQQQCQQPVRDEDWR